MSGSLTEAQSAVVQQLGFEVCVINIHMSRV